MDIDERRGWKEASASLASFILIAGIRRLLMGHKNAAASRRGQPPTPIPFLLAGLSKLVRTFAFAFSFCFTLYAPRRLHFRTGGVGKLVGGCGPEGGVAIPIHFLRWLIRLLNRFYDVLRF